MVLKPEDDNINAVGLHTSDPIISSYVKSTEYVVIVVTFLH